ncbi:hypothetical protein PM082_010749 [Marasmius tenuissimus]|nr:hypothetical protein PM082_010749 [Marasmius tenuissimus]
MKLSKCDIFGNVRGPRHNSWKQLSNHCGETSPRSFGKSTLKRYNAGLIVQPPQGLLDKFLISMHHAARTTHALLQMQHRTVLTKSYGSCLIPNLSQRSHDWTLLKIPDLSHSQRQHQTLWEGSKNLHFGAVFRKAPQTRKLPNLPQSPLRLSDSQPSLHFRRRFPVIGYWLLAPTRRPAERQGVRSTIFDVFFGSNRNERGHRFTNTTIVDGWWLWDSMSNSIFMNVGVRSDPEVVFTCDCGAFKQVRGCLDQRGFLGWLKCHIYSGPVKVSYPLFNPIRTKTPPKRSPPTRFPLSPTGSLVGKSGVAPRGNRFDWID